MAAIPVESAPEPQVTAPAAEPVVRPPVERRSDPAVAQAPAGAAAPGTIDSRPDPAVVAELEEIGESARALAEEMDRRRDLRAADLALAQGRLTTPPEVNAFALYTGVLERDPGSAEASRGLQTVRQALVNRALAQLADDALADARRTLMAAAEAGVNPKLIADLRTEVDYRQRLIDGRVGR